MARRLGRWTAGAVPRVVWLPEALRDILLHNHFLAEDFLEIGKPLGDGRRELFATFGAGAYVLRYRLKESDQPVIIRVLHTREWRESRYNLPSRTKRQETSGTACLATFGLLTFAVGSNWQRPHEPIFLCWRVSFSIKN